MKLSRIRKIVNDTTENERIVAMKQLRMKRRMRSRLVSVGMVKAIVGVTRTTVLTEINQGMKME
jgi:hypothetical protein